VEPRGFDVSELWAKRATHGDRLVRHLGGEVRAPSALFDVAADVVVPGARTGAIDPERARRIATRVVAPAANVPYVAGTPEILRGRGIGALPDFVCNAGAVIGYVSNTITSHEDMLALVERRIAGILCRSLEHRDGPFAGGCAAAEEFLRRWRPASGMPQGRPLA
jgi:glutamate dehydrogenase/leucine dehydrogenase